MKMLPLLLAVLSMIPLAACSQSAVAARQQSLNAAQSDVLANRETRLRARDDRMNASRAIWMQ